MIPRAVLELRERERVEGLARFVTGERREKPKPMRKTHCKWGHKFDYTGKRQQVCRRCALASLHRHRARKGVRKLAKE